MPSYTSSTGVSFERLSDDGQFLVLGDGERVLVLDAISGTERGAVELGSTVQDLSFVPDESHALIVGTTTWNVHQPATPVFDVDLIGLTSKTVVIPNCAAPIAVLRDGSRALLSPTFCQEGVASTGKQSWTNPDPVSVIDLSLDGPQFLKNLPGFGPVALDSAGKRAIAYLDVQRMDPSMFDDESQIPAAGSPRYQIMTIDPVSLQFALHPVGNVLPRFVLARDEKTLLVDATVQQVRGGVTLRVALDASGKVTADAQIFGRRDSLFGSFDLETASFTAFNGAPAALDRFVQMGDETRVFTLKMSADGTGGELYRLDLANDSVSSLGRSLRDIGLLSDGATLLLRERLPAVQVSTNGSIEWFRRERYCLSRNGSDCSASVEFRDSIPFQTGAQCTSYHDC